MHYIKKDIKNIKKYSNVLFMEKAMVSIKKNDSYALLKNIYLIYSITPTLFRGRENDRGN